MSFSVIEMRKFPTRLILCVVTKSIPNSSWVPGIYLLLEYLTGGPISTSQLASAMNEAHRFLVHRNPKLSFGWERAVLDAESLSIWLAHKRKVEGEVFAVKPN
jgi:hypothetical protein